MYPSLSIGLDAQISAVIYEIDFSSACAWHATAKMEASMGK
jgi:hypothetical protein